MANASTSTTSEPKVPDFHAWHVSNKGENGFWTKVGAAWPHRDGKGLSIQLDILPINGRIVLRKPLKPSEQEAGA